MTKHSLLLIAALATGCGGSNPFTELRNANNGQQGNLDFFADPATGVGQATDVLVRRADKGKYDCATYQTPLSFSGDSTSVQCHYADVTSPVEEVLDASCDQGGCSVVLSNHTGVSVTGLTPGSFTLTVRARLADGTVLTDSTAMAFVPIDAIGLECTLDYSCPGPNAVFVGSSFSYNAQPMNKGQYVGGTVLVTVDPPAIVEVTSGAQQYTVRALKPGVATLHLRSGKVERLQTIRVAAFEDVVSGRVHLRRELPCGQVVCVDADANRVGDVAPDKLSSWGTTFVLAWVLRDGSLAVGGAGRVTTSTAGAKVEVVGAYDPKPGDLSLMNFSVTGLEGAVCHAGRNSVSANMGSAKLEWSFEQVCN